MEQQRRLSDVGEAIQALGGNAALMNLTGARKTAVWWWKKNNRFPSRYYLVISKALTDAGYAANASLWGMEAADV